MNLMNLFVRFFPQQVEQLSGLDCRLLTSELLGEYGECSQIMASRNRCYFISYELMY